MTEITKTEISYEDVVSNLSYGTEKRRLLVFVRGTAGASATNLNLATYIPSVADVEGILYETINGAVVVHSTSGATWSTSTVTFGAFAGTAKAYEGAFICTLT